MFFQSQAFQPEKKNFRIWLQKSQNDNLALTALVLRGNHVWLRRTQP